MKSSIPLFVIALLVLDSASPTSRWAAPLMGVTILIYALANGIAALRRLHRS